MTESTKELTKKAKDIVRVQAQGVYRPEGGSFLATIIAAAADPRCDVAKMQALLAMQKEVAAEEARLAFIDAKLRLNDKLPTINKDGKIEYKDKNDGRGKPEPLKFASFENINEIIKPLLKEFGFDLWFSSEPGVPGMVNVIGHLEHAQGFARTTSFPMPHDGSGGKSAAQGWSSAFSFGKRVTTIGLLNIQTKALEDRDRDGSDRQLRQARDGMVEGVEARKVSPAQVEEMRVWLTDCGVGEKAACAQYQIEALGDLPADLLPAFKKRCQDRKAALGARRG